MTMANNFVTLDVVKTLLQNQADAFKSSFSILSQDVKEEIKSIRNDINDMKVSLQFSQAKLDEAEKSMSKIDQTVCAHGDNLNSMNEFADSAEAQLEYLENQSRRCNIRITGLPEDRQQERSWDDTELVVKKALKETLKIETDFDIERCHRVNRKSVVASSNNESSRPIVAKMSHWKEREIILKKARELKPEGIKFLPDLSNRTIQKRKEKVPALVAARKAGKIAYFILDKLVIKDKPPDWKSKEGPSSDSEVTFKNKK